MVLPGRGRRKKWEQPLPAQEALCSGVRGIFILSCLLVGAFAGCGREEPPVVEAEPGARKGLQLAVVARCGPRPPREDRIDLVVTADGRALLEEEVVPWSELAARLAAIPTPRSLWTSSWVCCSRARSPSRMP